MNPTTSSDPKDLVSQALATAGHERAQAWESRLSAQYATAPDDGHRMFLINRAWRLILGELDTDTSGERFCLTDGVEVSDWLALFVRGIVPCAVQHNLPLMKS